MLHITQPADFGWSDLGNWASLYDKLQHDTDGRVINNKTILRSFSEKPCLVWVRLFVEISKRKT